MRSMGIAVKMATKAIPTVRAVVVDGPAALAAVVDTFEVSAPQSEVAAMLAEIAEAVASRAEGLGVNGAIIRRADKSQRPSNQEGPRVRLLTEGAITAAVRAHVPETVIRDGEHCGTLYGPDKTAMDAAARSLLAGAAREVKYDEAAGAALAALSL